MRWKCTCRSPCRQDSSSCPLPGSNHELPQCLPQLWRAASLKGEASQESPYLPASRGGGGDSPCHCGPPTSGPGVLQSSAGTAQGPAGSWPVAFPAPLRPRRPAATLLVRVCFWKTSLQKTACKNDLCKRNVKPPLFSGCHNRQFSLQRILVP